MNTAACVILIIICLLAAAETAVSYIVSVNEKQYINNDHITVVPLYENTEQNDYILTAVEHELSLKKMKHEKALFLVDCGATNEIVERCKKTAKVYEIVVFCHISAIPELIMKRLMADSTPLPTSQYPSLPT